MGSYRFVGLLALSLLSSATATNKSLASQPRCVTLRSAIARTIEGDSELQKLHLEKVSCVTLRKLTGILNAGLQSTTAPGPLEAHGEPAAANRPTDLYYALRLPKALPLAETLPPPPPPQPQPGTAQYAQEYGQRFFLRQNNLDAFYFLYPSVPSQSPAASGSADTGAASAAKASGASFSWTDNQLAHSQVFNTQSYAAVVVARQLDLDAPTPNWTPYVSKWAIAPWIYANGVLNDPAKTTDKSALQFGGEAQVEVSRVGPFAITDVRVAPYYQTDFRGLASIQGIDALVEPYNLDWYLGGAYRNLLGNIAFFYWRAIGEFDARNVDAAGLTNMLPRTDYAWLGGNIIAKATLFPNSEIPELANRINLTFTAQWFDSVASPSTLHNFIAEIAYNLDVAGMSSVSFQYSNGTDKSTLVTANQYKLQLNVKM